MATYRGDPVLESLRDVGNSLRSASGDILQRRRLDIEEQGLLGRQEQERNLQQLRTQTAAAAGEAELTKARGGVAVTQQGMELARAAEGRAEAMHPLQMQSAQAGIDTQRFQVEEGRTLLPEKVRSMRASAAASAASAEHSRMLTKLSAAEYQAATQPVNLPGIVGMLHATGNQGYGDALMAMFPPNATPNTLQLSRVMGYMEKFFPQGMGQMKLGSIDEQLKTATDPEERIALKRERDNTLVNMGRNPRDDIEGITSEISNRVIEWAKEKDPGKRQQMKQIIDDLQLGRKGMLAKGQPQPTTPEQYFAIHKNYDTMEKLMQGSSEDLGHPHLGGMRNYLIDTGEISPPHENYITPNALYARVAGAVPPATPDELNKYKNGGTLMDGTVLPGNPNIKTQADADAYKRQMFVEAKYKQINGDERRLNAAMQPAPQAAAPTTLQSVRPPPTPEATARAEAERRLRTGRGTMATPEQIQQEMGRVQQEREAAGQPEALRQEAIRRLSSGRRTTVPSEAQIQQMVDQIQRERQRQGTGSIPPTGATDIQDR